VDLRISRCRHQSQRRVQAGTRPRENQHPTNICRVMRQFWKASDATF